MTNEITYSSEGVLAQILQILNHMFTCCTYRT